MGTDVHQTGKLYSIAGSGDFRPLPMKRSPFTKSHLLSAWLKCVNETHFCKEDTVTNGHLYKAYEDNRTYPHTKNSSEENNNFVLKGQQYGISTKKSRKHQNKRHVSNTTSHGGVSKLENDHQTTRQKVAMNKSKNEHQLNLHRLSVPRDCNVAPKVYFTNLSGEKTPFRSKKPPTPPRGERETNVTPPVRSRKSLKMPGTSPILGELTGDDPKGRSTKATKNCGRLHGGLAYRAFYGWRYNQMMETQERLNSDFTLTSNRKSSNANQREALALRHKLDGYHTICKQKLSKLRMEQKKMNSNLHDLKAKMATIALEPVESGVKLPGVRGADDRADDDVILMAPVHGHKIEPAEPSIPYNFPPLLYSKTIKQ